MNESRVDTSEIGLASDDVAGMVLAKDEQKDVVPASDRAFVQGAKQVPYTKCRSAKQVTITVSRLPGASDVDLVQVAQQVT